MKNLKVSLAWQILLAMVLGILLGSYLHYHSDSREWLIANLLSPAGDIFIHLIKMIVVPIVISTLIVGIAGVGDAKQLGRIGAKTILYFELITTVAIILGITLANVFQPGSGIDMSQLATVDISKYQNTTAEVQSHAHGLMGTILSLVPTNIIASMAKGDMLPIIFFSVLFGLGLSSLPATHREPLVTVFRSISETMFKVTHMVMRYAPVGVFALIAVTVANFGFASLWPLAKLVLLVHFAIIFFALVVLGIVARLCGLSIWILIRILKDELILAYSTASSESVLPRIIEKMEAYGAPASITSFVVPTGYSFNLDGSTLYQSIAAIFYRAAIRYRPVAVAGNCTGADADGDVERDCRRAWRFLRGVTGDAGQRGHSAGRAGVYRRCRPYPRHGAYCAKCGGECAGGAGDRQVGTQV